MLSRHLEFGFYWPIDQIANLSYESPAEFLVGFLNKQFFAEEWYEKNIHVLVKIISLLF